MASFYDTWISEQAEIIASAVTRLAMSGIFDETVYCFASEGKTPGFLAVETKQPLDAHSVVQFGQYGSRVSSVPRSQLRSFLWDACRRLPILPTA